MENGKCGARFFQRPQTTLLDNVRSRVHGMYDIGSRRMWYGKTLSSRWPRSSGHQVSSSRISCRRRLRPCPCSRSGPSRIAAPACRRQRRQHTRACSSRRPHNMSRSITTLQAGHAQAGDARDAQAERARGAQGISWAAALCVRRCCLEARQSERRRVQSFLTQVLSKSEQTM